MSEPDNPFLAHLRELRAEIAALSHDMDKRFEGVERRLDVMQEQGLRAFRAFRAFVGFRGRSDRAFGSVEMQLEDLERRVRTLESAQTLSGFPAAFTHRTSR